MAKISYNVSVHAFITASSPEDAVMQMVAYLQDQAHCLSYRVKWESVVEEFLLKHRVSIDAESIVRAKVDC